MPTLSAAAVKSLLAIVNGGDPVHVQVAVKVQVYAFVNEHGNRLDSYCERSWLRGLGSGLSPVLVAAYGRAKYLPMNRR